ncbi:pyridoxal phosphate-dependent decarboxylase family protein [Nocardioides sp. Kera G14]|uniref:pyridoxal phosphate-dependent decarboxylase family protein n=1 Tax=Nocardioides sp. Kera G14 TaxID=2884264 RepID=UPI001D12A31D|nr:aminotransferase class V-fold PLP-dependent enzyme [Nocardioides sp. Kera G14]UDY24199.1 aminotransferase class V-fold PLP-dependent enzyme [Nocardioides sp. Kera G14]
MPDPSDVLGRLLAAQQRDLPVHGGRTLAYVYDSGLPEVDRVAREAVAAYAGSNGLDPSAFPSLVQLENELVGYALSLVDGPPSAVGTVTSGGTESVLLAVVAARDSRPDVTRPRMVIPSTAHAAFHKAAHYFGVEAVVVEVGEDFRADAAAMAAALEEDVDRTILMVASAPSYAHGVIDPVTAIAATAAARGVRCHVDACIGGWVLPFGARLGREVEPWTFAVPGVTSISMDTHKYGYAPKGTSILLHRTPELRRPQLYATASWPGYTVINTTLQSTKSGGPLAGAWAVVQQLGDAGYLELARQVFEATDRLVAGIAAIDGLRLLAEPDSTLLAVATDDSLDVFTLIDEINQRGWHVQPQLSYGASPANAHLSLSAATLPHVSDFLSALADSVSAARALGPVEVDRGIADFVRSLDVSALSDEEFEGILAAAGLGTGDGLPERMAPINALLDLAAPATREAVVRSFVDQLSRPVRP